MNGRQKRMLMSFREPWGDFRQRFWDYDKPKALKDLIEMGLAQPSYLGLGRFQLTEKGKEEVQRIEAEER